jgi:hypothetical protein
LLKNNLHRKYLKVMLSSMETDELSATRVKSLRVLITIQTMEGPAGGSLYVRDFAVELFRQGHQPTVYCPRLGSVSDQLMQLGIPVMDCIDHLPHPNIIHGNSPIETVAVMLRFPKTPTVYVCHGWDSPDAIAPRLPGIVRYLAVSEHARDALLCFHGVPERLVHMHQNPVDLERFIRRPPLPEKPRRAIVLSNALTEANYLRAIEEACKAAGLSMDVVGLGMGTARLDPEKILASYDIVFAKGRSALEALATGCSVILCDISGFGELITTENYELLRLRNFGIRAMHLSTEEDTVSAQIRRYDPKDAKAVTDTVRTREGLALATHDLVGHYRASIAEFQTACIDWSSEQFAIAKFLETIAPTSNTFFLAQHLEPLQRHIRDTETKLRQLTEMLGTQHLSDSEARCIRMDAVRMPQVIEPNGTYQAVIRVTNQSGHFLSSVGKNPINFSYHWLNHEDHSVACYDGIRSGINPPLPSEASFDYPVQFKAPATPGSYILRLALVHEGIAWLDSYGAYTDTVYIIPKFL